MTSDNFEIKFEFSKILHHIKKIKWPLLILLAIVIFGIYLRSYHIDYPTIGYHNMKEDEFLSFTLNMYNSGDFLRTTWYDCSVSSNDYYGDPYKRCNFNEGETPIAVWSLMLFMSIFGWKLWSARLFIILFSAANSIIIYYIVKKLSDREYLSLLSAFFYAVLPLSIFFGRNIQMDAPSLFFGLCSLYYYLIWTEDNKTNTFIKGSVFFVLTAWFKITTLIVLFPLLLLLPYKRLIKEYKNYYNEFLVIIITLILSLAWILILAPALMPEANVNVFSSGEGFGKNGWVDLTFSIFSEQYWKDYKMILKSYLADNYSIKGVWLMLLGFGLFLLKYKSKISKFMMGYAIGIIIYIILFAYKWNAHNYYQFPFLAFAAICMANVIFQIGILLSSITGKKYLQILSIALIILFIAPFKQSTLQQFNVQFFGQEIAGKYINEHTMKDDIFLLERGIQHQVSWSARRFYYSVPQNETTLMDLEQNKGLKYIVMTNYGISTLQQKPIWNYISKNYHIVQIGFIQTAQGPQVYHMVLEKGGTVDYNSLSNKQPTMTREYELSYAKVQYYTIEVD